MITFVGDNLFRFVSHTVQRVDDALQLTDRFRHCIVGDRSLSRLVFIDWNNFGDKDRPLVNEGDNVDDEQDDRSQSKFCKTSISFLYISRSSSRFFIWISNRDENEAFLEHPLFILVGVEGFIERRQFCNSCNNSFSLNRQKRIDFK